MDRYTRKDAEAAFGRLLAALDKPPYDWTTHEGGWLLDYNGVYGGYVVAERRRYPGPNGTSGIGESYPLGYHRRSAREFVEAVTFALDCIEQTIGQEAFQQRMAPYYRALNAAEEARRQRKPRRRAQAVA